MHVTHKHSSIRIACSRSTSSQVHKKNLLTFPSRHCSESDMMTTFERHRAVLVVFKQRVVAPFSVPCFWFSDGQDSSFIIHRSQANQPTNQTKDGTTTGLQRSVAGLSRQTFARENWRATSHVLDIQTDVSDLSELSFS